MVLGLGFRVRGRVRVRVRVGISDYGKCSYINRGVHRI